jgi:ATP-dependent exoDNAse (exonuclease V) beta subunit
LLDDAGVLWRFPALEAWPPVDVERADGPDLPDPDHVAEQARSLARRRGEAARRMARPFSAAASEEAHHRLREAAGEGAAGGDAGTLARETAMAAGTAIHRALEELDPTADGAGEMERLRQLLPVWVAQAAPAAAFDAARAEAEEILARLAGGRLLARLRSLAPHTLARELPVLLAPSGEGEPRAGDDAPPPPVGFVSGAIDLLYRDPTDGELVVVDYKTDAVATEEQIRGRAGVYRPQGAVYARAVQEGLGLPRPPRVELWFLRADRAWPLEPAAGGGPAPPAPPAAPQLPEIAPSPVQGTLFDL